MKYKIILQPDQMLCGVTCLSMICAYYGINNMSLAVIRNFAQTDREGNTINSLCIAAEKLHMEAHGIKCNKKAIAEKKVKLPMIVHTLVDGLYNHYMVLFEANEKRVILGDPAEGQTEMTWDDFQKIWTQKAITLTPTENFQENKKYCRNYKFIINLILKFKKQLLILAAYSGVISGMAMVSTWFYSYLIDSILPENQLRMLLYAILAVTGAFLLTIEIDLMKKKFEQKFNRQLDRELVINIYKRITNLPMSFFSMRTTGDIQARYQDGQTLKSILTGTSLDVIIDIAYAVWAFVLLITIRWQVCVLAIFMGEIMYLIQKVYKKKLEDQSKEELKKSVNVESFVMSTFEANETIKNYHSEKLMEKKMADKYKEYQDVKDHNDKDQQVQQSVIEAIQNIGQTFMLGILGIFVMGGDITIGNLVTAYMYVNYLFTPIITLIGLQDQVLELSAVLDRLDDVFRVTTEEELDKKRINLNDKIKKIEFDNVEFRYGLRRPILKGINFEVNQGESIGIIGESGCGKTTLIKLIMGFFQTSGGEIKVNGRNIDNFTTSSIRKKIAYVSQNDYWFQDTIYNNLTIGNVHATKEQLDKVCNTVKMKHYIDNSPYGYNSMIEEDGINLSCGEKQRFSIAKALITNPDVLILDESTANLDAATEEYVVEQLRREEDKIKIIVAHRLNTLIHCNLIIAMKDGVIEEMGTPQELLKQEGMFKELWNIQNKVFEKLGNDDTSSETETVSVSY